MKKKVLSIALVLSFLFLGFVSATDTKITVNTLPTYQVMASVLEAGSVYSLIESFHGNADSSGQFSFVFSSSVNEFDVKVWLKENNEVLASERFDENTAGEDLVVDLYPSWYKKPVVNETPKVNESEEVVNDTVEENTTITTLSDTSAASPSLTGAATTKDTGTSSGSTIYYAFGGILLALIFIGVLAMRRRPHEYEQSEVKEIKVKKLSEFKKEQEEMQKLRVDSEVRKLVSESSDYKKAIDEAERKIAEAQQEIRRLKNEDKIKDAKRKLIEDEKELMRLRRGE